MTWKFKYLYFVYITLFRLTEPKFKMEAYSNAKFSFETKSCPVLLSKW